MINLMIGTTENTPELFRPAWFLGSHLGPGCLRFFFREVIVEVTTWVVFSIYISVLVKRTKW